MRSGIMETMKTTIWKQGKPKWKHQKQWTYSKSFVLNHNLDEIRQGKLYKPIHGRVTCVLPRTFFVNLTRIQVVDPYLITLNFEDRGSALNRNFCIGNAIWQATCGLSAFDLTFAENSAKRAKDHWNEESVWKVMVDFKRKIPVIPD